MKVLIIYEASTRKGGIQVHVSTLIASLRELGDTVTVFPVPPLFYTKQGLVTRLLSILKNTSKVFTQLIQLLKTTNTENPDIIHVHGPRMPLILGYLLSRKEDKPLIVTMHEPKSKATRYNPLWKKGDKILTISEEIRSFLIRLGGNPDKIIYMPNMVKMNLAVQDIKTKPNNIVFIGRLHPDKVGILKVLLQAAPTILDKVPDTRIQIVGPDGSSKKEIEDAADEINKKYGRAVTLIGYTPNPEFYIANSKLVIGEARVGIESMIAGKPTIVGYSQNGQTFTGDLVDENNLKQLESHNFTGVNYTRKIDPDELSGVIIDILLGADYTVTASKYCQKYTEKKFGYKNVTRRIQKIYEEEVEAR